MKTSSFRNYKIDLPSSSGMDWPKILSESFGAKKEIFTFQARAASLLESITDLEATPERIGWYSKWIKAFTNLRDTIAAFEHNSISLLNIIDRSAFEEMLQMRTIIEPISKLYGPLWHHRDKNIKISKSSDKFVFDQTIDNLCGYTTWCLWNDKWYYEEVLKPKTLEDIWDPSPIEEIRSDSKILAVHEYLYGPLDIETNKKTIAKGKDRMKQSFKAKLQRVKNWLYDPSLSKWNTKLRNLEKDFGRNISLFTLFDVSPKSVRQRLKEFDLMFAYPIYMSGSMLIHGSTVENLFNIQGQFLYPKLIGQKDICESTASDIARKCNDVLVFLSLLKEYVWGVP